jgi:hypothetical protein
MKKQPSFRQAAQQAASAKNKPPVTANQPPVPASKRTHRDSVVSKSFCSCLGSKSRKQQGEPDETTHNEADTPQKANGGTAHSTSATTPTANITINVTGKNVVVKQTEDVVSQFNDPVRSIRISFADIPRMQSRMAS